MTRKTYIDPPDLPDELWWKIIEFLPTEEVRRLYGVNRLFFEAAFQKRYRVVEMNGPLGKRLGRFRDLERRLKYYPFLEFSVVIIQRNLRQG